MSDYYTALFDANVFYPAPVRDLLMQLAVTDLFRARWTADIHREWIEALLRNEPHRDRGALERTRDLMDSNQHPDEFLCNHLDLAQGLFCSAIQQVRRRLKNPPYTIDQYLDILTRNGLVAPAAELRPFADLR